MSRFARAALLAVATFSCTGSLNTGTGDAGSSDLRVVEAGQYDAKGTAGDLNLSPDRSTTLPSCGHPYPRTGVFHWGGAPAWWYSRFDMLSLRKQSTSTLAKIRAMNPNVIFLYMEDWNVAAHLGDKIPKGCQLKTSTNQHFGWYKGAGASAGQRGINLTDHGKTGGKLCRRWFAEYLTNNVDLKKDYAGISTDGLYAGKHVGWAKPKDLDLDNNGVNDNTEHGKSWVVDTWNSGVKGLLKELRTLLGPNRRMMVNTGVGYLSHASVSPINGALLEFAGAETNWDWHRGVIKSFIKSTMKPHTTLFASNPSGADPGLPKRARDYFEFVRYVLTKSMLVDGYYHYETGPHHTYGKYYDEFDATVGCPTSEMQEVGNSDVWVRFFSGGAAVHNANGKSATVTDKDLKALKGYAGPYYRFAGGQVPAVNNGQKFTSVTLKGHSWGSGVVYKVGDGIVLVSKPRTVVADIVVDDLDYGTDPGSSRATLTGSWKVPSSCKDGREHYTLVCYAKDGSSHYTTDPGATATYTPTIGLAGRYQVYEWHGYLDSKTESSKAPYVVTHANGQKAKGVIDQTKNPGQWNSLGTFRFSKGTGGNLKLSGSASGAVLADAVRFVYRGP